MQPIRWTEFATVAELRDATVEAIAKSAQAAINERGRFDIVLAGGSTPKTAYAELASLKTDWSAWHVWFGDERCLPPEHADRNSRMAQEVWFSRVTIPAAQIHAIPAELGAQAAAAEYCRQLDAVAEFDLVLLGLGEDGHTASLFPGHVWEAEPSQSAIPVHNAPKPPSDRVSLSLSRLKRALHVLFIVTGAGKRDAVQAWKQGDSSLPVTGFAGMNGVEVYLDADANPAA